MCFESLNRFLFRVLLKFKNFTLFLLSIYDSNASIFIEVLNELGPFIDKKIIFVI
jgi:hypothetical protein